MAERRSPSQRQGRHQENNASRLRACVAFHGGAVRQRSRFRTLRSRRSSPGPPSRGSFSITSGGGNTFRRQRFWSLYERLRRFIVTRNGRRRRIITSDSRLSPRILKTPTSKFWLLFSSSAVLLHRCAATISTQRVLARMVASGNQAVTSACGRQIIWLFSTIIILP